MTPSSRANLRVAGSPAFTLVELLVSIAVAVIVLVALVLITSGALKSSTSINNSLVALSSANAVLDLVANDLASLPMTGKPSPTGQTVTSGPYEFLQARPDPNTGNLNGVTPALLMLNTASAQDSISNANDLGLQPRAVCYQIAYQDPFNPANTHAGAKVWGLYRTAQTASNTFANFLGRPDLYLTSAAPSGATMSWQSLFAANPLPASSTFIGGNFVDFQLLFYAYPISPSGQMMSTPELVYSTATAGAQPLHLTTLGYVIANNAPGSNSTFNPPGLDSAHAAHGPIAFVDASVVVLETNGAIQLNDGAISLQQARTMYGHNLTRRIVLSALF